MTKMSALDSLKKLFERQKYEYGTIEGKLRRRDMKTGEVQFILWKAGEHGHKDDCWYQCDESYWHKFKKYKE